MRALIIDDDPVTRLYFEEILSSHLKVLGVESGADGVAAFSQALTDGQRFSVVLVDIRMPGMDGHQTVQKLRGIEQEAGIKGEAATAVIMVSAMDDARNVNRAFFQGGAVSYLSKPVDPEVLLSELRKFGIIG